MNTILLAGLVVVAWLAVSVVFAAAIARILRDGRRRYQRAYGPLQPLDLSRERRRQVARRRGPA